MEGVYQLLVLDTTTSTNDEVLARAQARAQVQVQAGRCPLELPLAVLAREQTAGRGRLGRSWVSPAGGLYLSVLLRLAAPGVDASKVASLSPLVALALREALQGFSASALRIKWPNDVLAPTGKLAGILIEMKPASAVFGARAAGSKEQLVVVGMGVNVRRPAEGAFEAAAYLVDGRAQDPHLEEVATAVLKALLQRYTAWQAAAGSFAGFIAEYTRFMAQLGESVCVRNAQGDEVEQGVVQGIDAQGRLLLSTVSGDKVVAAGEVSLRDS